jgi:hypothetical protein
MNRIYVSVMRWYATARRRQWAVKQAVSTRSVFMALALALIMGSAIQPSPALATSAGANYAYYVFASNQGKDDASVCVGDNVLITVNVARVHIENNVQSNRQNETGIWVQGSLQGPSIGKFIIARKQTGFDYEKPGMATFVFHADKAGKTALTFNAEIYYWKYTVTKWIFGPVETAVSNLVNLTVADCKYKATINSRWQVPGLEYAAVIDEVELTLDGNGNYTGTATVTWVGSWQVIPQGMGAGMTCTTKLTAPPSQADLKGTMNDSGYLVVNITYQPVTAPSWNAVCKDSTGATPPVDNPVQLASGPLKISVPASTGGVSTQTTDLGDQISGGTAVIDIFPESGQATSFNPDSRTARSDSSTSWWTMVWSDFPGLFSTALVLR